MAAYCRVSTNSLEQQTSLSSQEQYYEEWIKRIPHWTFAGIYSDIGSGTQAKGRRRFNAMISACRRGKIDMILTKSAHRFARNTVDALETIRMLRRWKFVFWSKAIKAVAEVIRLKRFQNAYSVSLQSF